MPAIPPWHLRCLFCRHGGESAQGLGMQVVSRRQRVSESTSRSSFRRSIGERNRVQTPRMLVLRLLWLCVSLSVCQFVCLSVCLSFFVWLSLFLSLSVSPLIVSFSVSFVSLFRLVGIRKLCNSDRCANVSSAPELYMARINRRTLMADA